ncbi:MAG: pyridine nucleotide-disulfide oxidoreductase [Spirochaetes bacterium]|nr:MAG: pyridine nucleotide-disulfide oxidoreductase [Spirochaetota bacterium]RKY03549.1 MAG: pyridine nucleotide-disulfide oxidoreductase [Spirochaetota bacterium]
MLNKRYDAIVIGGGAAGMSAANKLGKSGLKVALLEREAQLGGILNQCIHNGFGLHYFKEELTGPEYAYRFIEPVSSISLIETYLETTVINIKRENQTKIIQGFSKNLGLVQLSSNAVILAMGSRERNRGNIGIPGTRPSGIFTAGLAQRFVNIEGINPGKEVVIVGSGDIGLIMARRMTWIGSKVKAVIEIQPYPSGLTRNIVQCLNDFNIPLYLSHIVSKIYGIDRIEGVEVTPLENGKPVFDKRFKIECDTLLLSVGLVPENELSKKAGVSLNPDTQGAYVDAHMMTSVDGIFSCGNVLHIHDLVDYVTEESERTANFLIKYLDGTIKKNLYPVKSGSNIKYVLPNWYDPSISNSFYLRSMIVKNNAKLIIRQNDEIIKEKKLIHVQPSEMISVKLTEKDISKAFNSGGKNNILEFSII